MKKQKIICAALVAALVAGSCPGKTVEAVAGKPEQKSLEETIIDEMETGTPEEAKEMTPEELAQYFSDSVFIGDSIMVGFQNYCGRKNNYVHGTQFLASGSFSAFNALRSLESTSVHPKYNGVKYHVWDAVPLMGCKRVFILLGTNDFNMGKLEKSRDRYKEVIDKIVEASPDIEINIISVTYTLKGKGKGALNNDNVNIYNLLLHKMAIDNGWGYVDVCLPLSDGEGNLAAAYCSDGFVHLSNSAYAVWEEELVKYANKQTARKAEQAETEADEETVVQREVQIGTAVEMKEEAAEKTAGKK